MGGGGGLACAWIGGCVVVTIRREHLVDEVPADACAVVRSKGGDELCRFHREAGGLYVAKLKLRNPAGFGRQE